MSISHVSAGVSNSYVCHTAPSVHLYASRIGLVSVSLQLYTNKLYV